MSKMSIIIPEPEGEGLVSSGQMLDVYNGYLNTMRKLRDLAHAVKLFRVTFARVGESTVFGPCFDIVFVDPFGTESSHSTSYEYMGDRAPRPTPQVIADTLAADDKLPRFIRQHLAAGAQRMAAINASFKRLGKREGYRLEYGFDKSTVWFRAESKDEALKHVARLLCIRYPMTPEMFRERGARAVFAGFTQQIFPPKAA